MFCRKCKYTSFDYLDTCPECGFDWKQQKKNLNLDWLKPSTNHPDLSRGAFEEDLQSGSSPEQPPVTEPELPTETFSAEPESPFRQDQEPPAKTQATAEMPVYTEEELEQTRDQEVIEYTVDQELDLEEIEYSFEDMPEAPTEEASSGNAEDSRLMDNAEDWPVFFDDEEVEIDLEEEMDQPQSMDKRQDTFSESTDSDSRKEEGVDEWADLLQELEIEADSLKDPDKTK